MNIYNMNYDYELSINIKEVLSAINAISDETKTLKQRYDELDKTLTTLATKNGQLGITIKKIENKSNSILELAQRKEILQAEESSQDDQAY